MRATTEATKRTMTPEEEDRFYGINREGVPGYELECGTFLPQVSLFENKYFLKD